MQSIANGSLGGAQQGTGAGGRAQGCLALQAQAQAVAAVQQAALLQHIADGTGAGRP